MKNITSLWVPPLPLNAGRRQRSPLAGLEQWGAPSIPPPLCPGEHSQPTPRGGQHGQGWAVRVTPLLTQLEYLQWQCEEARLWSVGVVLARCRADVI